MVKVPGLGRGKGNSSEDGKEVRRTKGTNGAKARNFLRRLVADPNKLPPVVEKGQAVPVHIRDIDADEDRAVIAVRPYALYINNKLKMQNVEADAELRDIQEQARELYARAQVQGDVVTEQSQEAPQERVYVSVNIKDKATPEAYKIGQAVKIG